MSSSYQMARKGTAYNGEMGNVVRYVPSKERFVVEHSGNGSQILTKPHNLEKV